MKTKIVLGILISFVSGDVPVTCSKKDKNYIGSSWTLHVSEGGP